VILKRYERFLKFSVVGGSGVMVNLGVYALLTGWGGLDFPHGRLLAYALSVEISIVTNFLLNDAWTFRDRVVHSEPFVTRGVRFHVVSLAGFAINWGTFALLNLLFPAFSAQPLPVLSALPGLAGLSGDYAFAILGILLGTAVNYLGNLKWTWG